MSARCSYRPAILSLVFLIGSRAGAAVPASAVLPAAIHSTLDQEYPGWKFAPVTTQVQQAFKKHQVNRSPSLVQGDFDHDGKMDYALQIVLTEPGQEEQIVIVFLARGSTYEETIVQSMGLDPTVYLWISKKKTTETGADAQDKFTSKSVLLVLGGIIGDTTYAYEEGKFQEIKLPEDPDHPDPTIPRATESPQG